jgi:REP element-mobilizing transposase RayT
MKNDSVRARHAVPQQAVPQQAVPQQAVPLPNRRSIRLRGYDYSRAGAYFVTICTLNRECLFGNIENGEMRLNTTGKIVQRCWDEIPFHFSEVELDEFVVMPNHIHGIAVIVDGRGTACRAPTSRAHTCRAPAVEQFGQPVSGSIPTIVRSFKSAATRRINQLRNTPGENLWQRNYWEHIVRNEQELHRIRKYIQNNPAQWELDRLFV